MARGSNGRTKTNTTKGMRTRLLQLLAVLAIAGSATLLWHQRWRISCYLVERELNGIYRDCRPFPYRWADAPYSPVRDAPLDEFAEKKIGVLTGKINEVEQANGKTARSLRLRGRLLLLHGNYDNAISNYRLAMHLDASDPSLQLESGIAFALRARAEDRALDYASALEQVLESSKRQQTPESLFDLALLFEEAQLRLQALDLWKAAQAEPVAEWRREAQKRHEQLHDAEEARERRIHDLTDSPTSYLAHAEATGGSIELVLGEALESWLSTDGSEITKNALENLAMELEKRHHDPWLRDLLKVRSRPGGQAALRRLSEAWTANQQGEHLRAGTAASAAEGMFEQLGSSAGVLRARLEYAYSVDRVWKEKECMQVLPHLLPEARRHHYVWLEGQALLEQASCLAQTRKISVIELRLQAERWVGKTGYLGISLRAQSFLLEPYGGLDSRVRIWRQGIKSLTTFWKEALPPLRGYFPYFSLAASAREAGQLETALAFLQEGIRLLRQSPNRPLLALVLSYLGSWQMQNQLEAEGQQSFLEMEQIFSQLNPDEVKQFWRDSQINRAEAENISGQPRSALTRLQTLVAGTPFPYLDFGPTQRRRLLPTFGNVYLALRDLDLASKHFQQMLSEQRHDLDKIKDRTQRNSAQRETGTAWKGLATVQLLHGDKEQALQTWEAFRGGWMADPEPKAIQVPSGTAFLVFAHLNQRLYAWLLTANGFKQNWIDATAAKKLAFQFSALAADPDSPAGAVQKSGKELYHLLIEPFEDKLAATDVLIVDADQELAAIPWAALPDRKGNILLTRYAISQVESWMEISTSPQLPVTDFGRPLIVVEPALGPELAGTYPVLRDVRRQAEGLHGMLPDAAYLPGAKAELQATTKALSIATMMHFAGHGISNGGFGALLLAPPAEDRQRIELLTAEEIEKLNLSKLSLAVLASCSSGEGENRGSVDLDSLVRGFMKAGTRRVIAARWNLRADKTADMMSPFYTLLLKKVPPAEALRQAALEIHANPRTAHPYYWAGLQVFGTP
jgi:CHAT domain-containing protein